MLRHITEISDLSKEEFLEIISLGLEMKANPAAFKDALAGKTLLALFSKPSLRTRVSLETAMTKLGGHCIYYQLGAGAPLGVKESIEDTAKCVSRFVDIMSARVQTRKMITDLAANLTIPLVNALDDWAHPLQMLADFMLIREKFGTFEGLKFVYLGDSFNNVTYDLMRSCALVGMDCAIGCPDDAQYTPPAEVIESVNELNKVSGGKLLITHNAEEAVRGRHIIYADSWFSYGIPLEEKERRVEALTPFRVTTKLMDLMEPNAIFMNCLPAMRGYEQDADVIDGPRSVVFDEAENRLWSAMACLLWQIRSSA
uniref:ornithine carbamoyltransferase n=1 Tax=Chilomastix cuspidata TaxID=1476591 RepID=A0A142D9X4_9EUKA|nr:ornithine transcarbamylase [Chilomastix cuspidata]